LPGRQRTRLVALTGYGHPTDRQAALEAGFNEHLVKPVKPSELSRVLSLSG
jgi:CheY-like chemotaxis protein